MNSVLRHSNNLVLGEYDILSNNCLRHGGVYVGILHVHCVQAINQL